MVLLLGDSVQLANAHDLEHVFGRIAAAAAAPVAAVNGNHDLRLGETFAAHALTYGIRLLHDEPLELHGVAVAGVAVERGPKPPQYVGRPATTPRGPELVALASHFPVVSEASRVSAAGLPYPGDLVDRAQLESRLRSGRPTVLLCGHIHVRCSADAGPLLQLTVGALIEPPFDATIIELDAKRLVVRRTARRLGEIAPIDPVFSPDEECWRWTGERWEGEVAAPA